MRRVVLLILLLLVLPSVSLAGMAWVKSDDYTHHSSKSGSSFYKEKRSQFKKITPSANLGKKAAQAAGIASKIGVTGAVVKGLVKNGKAGLYGTVGLAVVQIGLEFYRDIKAHPDRYPTISNLLCQTLGACPALSDQPSSDNNTPYPVGSTFKNGSCGISQVVSIFANRVACKTEEDWESFANQSSCTVYYLRTGSKPMCEYVLDPTYKTHFFDILTLKTIDQIEENQELPASLSSEQEEELSERILRELEKLDEKADRLADELDRLIQNNPDSVIWDPLDNKEVKQELYQEEADKLQQQKEDIETQLQNDPNNEHLQQQLQEIEDAIQQLDKQRNKEILEEEAKEQEKQEQEQKEQEKFDNIGREDWEPYDPGPFDIPARFNRLINTIKGTSLFSFSSGFFESLPSGGSPIVHFQGGDTFGNHTIDLSDTMQVGLVAFRAVVMVIFGFLAIRAVIMKR